MQADALQKFNPEGFDDTGEEEEAEDGQARALQKQRWAVVTLFRRRGGPDVIIFFGLDKILLTVDSLPIVNRVSNEIPALL